MKKILSVFTSLFLLLFLFVSCNPEVSDEDDFEDEENRVWLLASSSENTYDSSRSNYSNVTKTAYSWTYFKDFSNYAYTAKKDQTVFYSDEASSYEMNFSEDQTFQILEGIQNSSEIKITLTKTDYTDSEKESAQSAVYVKSAISSGELWYGELRRYTLTSWILNEDLSVKTGLGNSTIEYEISSTGSGNSYESTGKAYKVYDVKSSSGSSFRRFYIVEDEIVRIDTVSSDTQEVTSTKKLTTPSNSLIARRLPQLKNSEDSASGEKIVWSLKESNSSSMTVKKTVYNSSEEITGEGTFVYKKNELPYGTEPVSVSE